MDVMRDVKGRIIGKVSDFYSSDNEWYKNERVKGDLLFPRHNDNQSSEVRVFHISELQKQK